jgi:glycosyltransferase involved in cell wall biosynthesis
MQRVIDRLFLTRQFDIVQYELTQMAMYRPTVPRPTLINTQNVEYELLGRVAAETRSPLAAALKFSEAHKVRVLEKRLWHSANHCAATSARDAVKIRLLSGVDTSVVPNGVDTKAFARPASSQVKPHHLVFTGVMRHEPNADAALWYIEEIHPRVLREIPDTTVAIVGADPPSSLVARASGSVQVTGRVEDIRPWLWEAAVAIVPLRSGGGTRLKIVEAFAAETPVVSTTIGAEGIDAAHDEHLLIGDSAERFAAQTIRLLREPALAAGLAHSALRLARDRYDWSTIARQLVDAQDRAVENFALAVQDDSTFAPVDWGRRLWPGVEQTKTGS